eukprot:g31684.t1
MEINPLVQLIHADPYDRLVQKVKSHGVRGELARWIQDWLSQRRQMVAVQGSFSEWTAVTCGVPQGSVLGTLLFVIYINDLEENITGLISTFVGNTNVGGVSDSEANCQKIQQDIDLLEAWAEKWLMEFNLDECEVKHFGRSRTGGIYAVNGRTLGSIDMQRDLGVQVDRPLKVAVQVDKFVRKAYGMLAFIERGIE